MFGTSFFVNPWGTDKMTSNICNEVTDSCLCVCLCVCLTCLYSHWIIALPHGRKKKTRLIFYTQKPRESPGCTNLFS